MFLGHFGVAFAAKRLAPGASLAMLFVAAQFIDLLWPLLVLAGVERLRIAPGITTVNPLDFVHYPWSHSLLMTLVWGVLLGGAYWWWRRRRGREALVVGLLVPSHWLLDLLVHRPDLPLAPGLETVVGFGGWQSLGLSLALELGLFVAGLAIYLWTVRDRLRPVWLGVLVALLLAIYAGSLWGTAPPSPEMVAASALGMWLFVGLAWLVERGRGAKL